MCECRGGTHFNEWDLVRAGRCRTAEPERAIQEAQTPDEPEHTGLAAIVYTTGADFKAFPRRKSTWVILAIGGAAAAAAHPLDNSAKSTSAGLPP